VAYKFPALTRNRAAFRSQFALISLRITAPDSAACVLWSTTGVDRLDRFR